MRVVIGTRTSTRPRSSYSLDGYDERGRARPSVLSTRGSPAVAPLARSPAAIVRVRPGRGTNYDVSPANRSDPYDGSLGFAYDVNSAVNTYVCCVGSRPASNRR